MGINPGSSKSRKKPFVCSRGYPMGEPALLLFGKKSLIPHMETHPSTPTHVTYGIYFSGQKTWATLSAEIAPLWGYCYVQQPAIDSQQKVIPGIFNATVSRGINPPFLHSFSTQCASVWYPCEKCKLHSSIEKPISISCYVESCQGLGFRWWNQVL